MAAGGGDGRSWRHAVVVHAGGMQRAALRRWRTPFAEGCSLLRTVGSSLLCGLLTGCLVVDQIEFSAEENVPASIVSASEAFEIGTSLGEIVFVNLDDPEGRAAQGGELRFPVLVRDANLTQTLQWRVYLDFQDALPTNPVAFDELEPQSNLAFERPLSFSLSLESLNSVGCHKVELLVSAEFVPSNPGRTPVEEGDLAVGVWWLDTRDQAGAIVDFRTCP